MGTTENKRLKINFFGEGIRISKIEIPEDFQEQWNDKIQTSKQSIETLLLDPFFYYNLKIPNVNSYHDLTTKSWEGIRCDYQSIFEIWSQRKKVYKDTLNHVTTSQTLFPLFNTIEDNWKFDEKGIYVIEHEKGLIRSAIIEHQNAKLDMDDFSFHVAQCNDSIWLDKLYFLEQECCSSNSDTMITKQYVNIF